MRRNCIACLILALILSMPSCSVLSTRSHDRDISMYLPNVAGFTWNYSGFAEYDHQMRLDSIEREGRTTKYNISGMVGDPSGGEADRDFSLSILYTVGNGVWIQEKREQAMMDSDFDRLEILRGPIKKGATWTQQQTDKQGNSRTLECTIEEVKFETVRVLVVLYKEQGSDYYERREISTGQGIQRFEKLWMSPEGNFEIGYQLYEGF